MPEWLVIELALLPLAGLLIKLWSDVRSLKAWTERHQLESDGIREALGELKQDVASLGTFLRNRPNGYK